MKKHTIRIFLTIILLSLMAIFCVNCSKSLIIYAAESENIKISAEVVQIQEAGTLKEFSTGKKLFEFADVDFRVIFKNIGNTNLTASGDIKIKNSFSKDVAQIAVNPQKITTYVGQTTEFNPHWKRASYLGFGQYKAGLELKYGQGNIITSSLIYWVIPIRMIAALILIIILIINRPAFAPAYYNASFSTSKIKEDISH